MSNGALIRELRERTGCGIKDCRNALQEHDNDIEKAIAHLRKKGLADADKKSGRSTEAGFVFNYVHSGGQIGVIVELNCETDFVAKNDLFQEFGRDLCMQICAMSPVAVSRDQVSEEDINKEREIYREQIKDKPENVQDKIIDGKIDKYFKENVLLEQGFIKEEKRTVEEVMKEKIATLKENISIKRFARFQIGS